MRVPRVQQRIAGKGSDGDSVLVKQNKKRGPINGGNENRSQRLLSDDPTGTQRERRKKEEPTGT